MNADIRLSVDFFDHPKTIKLQRRHGLEGVHSLLRLWLFAAKHKVTGELSDMDAEEIAIAAKFSGDAAAFVATLVDIRWVDEKEGVHYLHDWVEHNGWASSADDRSDKSRFSRMAKLFPKVYADLKAKGYEAVTAEEYKRFTAPSRGNKNASLNDGSTVVATVVEGAVEAGVKEVVDEALTERTSPLPLPLPSPLPLPTPSKDKPLSATADVALEIILKDETFCPITKADVQDWIKLFPGVDVVEALAKIEKTCRNTPSKRQDGEGIRGHIVGCFTMMQNRQETFERIWKRYPNKDGKKEAEKHFRATVQTEDDLKAIHKALDNYLAMLAANPTRPMKNGSTWFNNWHDWKEDPTNGQGTERGKREAAGTAAAGKGAQGTGTGAGGGDFACGFKDRSGEWD